MRNREKNEKERRQEGDRKEGRKGERQREEDEMTEGVRNCDRTEKRGRKKETGRRIGRASQESLCNRSFLLFPGVVAEGESSLGEVNLDSR